MGKRKVPKAALDIVAAAARHIRELEAEALRVLHGAGDTAAHRAGLTRKCLVLEALPEDAAGALKDASGASGPVDAADVAAFATGLESFAHRAGQALSLESVFFMGALLYPEDYQEGQPNDLERFLDRFEAA
uniref:Uncharacterized protein n=1 Tax=Desulfovibrio sp. U5L TaxID=596152 RepID=I2Q3W9_9BACT